jgi:hypothetical protein
VQPWQKLAVDVGAEGPVELLRRELAYVIERGLVGSIVDQDVKPAELLVCASYDLLAVFLVADIAAQQDRTTLDWSTDALLPRPRLR